MAVEGNAYDEHTLKPQLKQQKKLPGGKIKKAIGSIEIVKPKMLRRESSYLKKKREKRCRSRAGIEGLISHLKHDHRMLKNYLKGMDGIKTNTLLAAVEYNMRK